MCRYNIYMVFNMRYGCFSMHGLYKLGGSVVALHSWMSAAYGCGSLVVSASY